MEYAVEFTLKDYRKQVNEQCDSALKCYIQQTTLTGIQLGSLLKKILKTEVQNKEYNNRVEDYKKIKNWISYSHEYTGYKLIIKIYEFFLFSIQNDYYKLIKDSYIEFSRTSSFSNSEGSNHQIEEKLAEFARKQLYETQLLGLSVDGNIKFRFFDLFHIRFYLQIYKKIFNRRSVRKVDENLTIKKFQKCNLSETEQLENIRILLQLYKEKQVLCEDCINHCYKIFHQTGFSCKEATRAGKSLIEKGSFLGRILSGFYFFLWILPNVKQNYQTLTDWSFVEIHNLCFWLVFVGVVTLEIIRAKSEKS